MTLFSSPRYEVFLGYLRCLLLKPVLSGRAPPIRLRSAMARRLDDCRGSRVGCFREIAGGTPATTALLWREGGDVHTKKRS